MKIDITLADLVMVDTETGEELCTLDELIPDENSEAVDPYVEMPKMPSWMQYYDSSDDEILDEDDEEI